jgi:hypothetical protein
MRFEVFLKMKMSVMAFCIVMPLFLKVVTDVSQKHVTSDFTLKMEVIHSYETLVPPATPRGVNLRRPQLKGNG